MPAIHHENIPFFNDLHTAAIRPAARLWSKSRDPGNNGLLAYSDFVAELNDVKVAPPPRAIVKRWVAGVQAGLIGCPGGEPARPAVAHEDQSQEIDIQAVPAYFTRFPHGMTSAVQAAWDRASGGGFESRFMFEALSRDLFAIGFAGPTRADFDAWAKGVERGEIERPASQIEKTNAAPTPEPFAPLTPQSFASATVSVSIPAGIAKFSGNPLSALVERAVEDKASALVAEARVCARKLIAEELRELAAELESAAA